jgi:hypothetical protein
VISDCPRLSGLSVSKVVVACQQRAALFGATSVDGAAKSAGSRQTAQHAFHGVEDRSDWDWVRKTGCHVAQGYFVANPMPGSQVAG